MKTCATCQFRAEPRDTDWPEALGPTPNHGTCTKIVHGNGYRQLPPWATDEAAVLDGSGYAARLVVLPTFGCVLHEEKR